jgi:hypothetical protein
MLHPLCNGARVFTFLSLLPNEGDEKDGLLLASVALAVLLTAGVACAATIDWLTGQDLRAGRRDDIACGAGDDAVLFDEGIDVVTPPTARL